MTSPSQPAEKALRCPGCGNEALSNFETTGYFCINDGCIFAEEMRPLILKDWNSLPRYTASDLQAAEVRGAEKFKRYLLDDFKVQFNLRAELESISPSSICRAALPKDIVDKPLGGVG